MGEMPRSRKGAKIAMSTNAVTITSPTSAGGLPINASNPR